MKWIFEIAKFLSYTHIIIASAAASMALQIDFFYTDIWKATPSTIIVFCATLTLYGAHRLVGVFKIKQSSLDIKNRYTEIARYGTFNTVITAIGLLVGGFTLVTLFPNVIQILLFALSAIIGTLYILPLLKGGKRLRDFNFIKIFLIAFIWCIMTVAYPYFDYDSTVDQSISLLFLEKVFYIIGVTIPFDIRDSKLDQQLGTQTLVTKWGTKNAKLLAILAIILALLLCILNTEIYTTSTTLAIVVSYIFSIFLIEKSNVARHDLYYSFGIDGSIIFQTLLVFIAAFYF